MTVPVNSHMSLRDLLAESFAGMLSRPGRTALTILGTVLGIAALVATLGLANTAGNQIVGHFDELAATTVSVENVRSGFFSSSRTQTAIPFDAQRRLTRLNGVTAAGTLGRVQVEGLFRSVPINDPLGRSEHSIDLYAASPGLFDAAQAQLSTGRFFDEGHSDRREPVAVIGAGAAARLNINRVDQQPAIFIDNKTLVVVGIVEDVTRESILLDSIIIPNGTARQMFGFGGPAEVLISTEVGAAQLIGEQAVVALSPDDPDALRATLPPEPRRVQSAIESDVNSLFLVLGGVALLVGGIGIANVTLVSVLERVGEIGVRRALGAGRRHIAWQFLTESAAMGVLGGVIGASGGVLTVVIVSAFEEWTPVMEPWIPFAAALLGGVVGLAAGTYPSLRAASLEPVAALRSGTR